MVKAAEQEKRVDQALFYFNRKWQVSKSFTVKMAHLLSVNISIPPNRFGSVVTPDKGISGLDNGYIFQKRCDNA